MRSIIGALRWLAAILCLALFAGPALSQTRVGDVGTKVPICIARVQPGDTPRVALIRGGFHCGSDDFRLGPGDFWARSGALDSRTPYPHVRVRFGTTWNKAFTLYAVYADDKVAIVRATSGDVSRLIALGSFVDVELPIRRVPLVRLLWRIEGAANARTELIAPYVTTDAESARSNMVMAALYAGFAGLVGTLLIYNLALWGALRYRFLPAYCAMLVMLMIYAVGASGVLAMAFPGIDNLDRLRITYISLGGTAAMAVLFARRFFERRIFVGWIDAASRAAIVLLAMGGLLFSILSFSNVPLGNLVYTVCFVAGLSIVGPILWQAWRLRSDYLWLFAIAWSIPIVFAMGRLLTLVHVVPTSFLLDNSTQFSMMFEALMSSLAIAYRIQMLRGERDAARAGEREARVLADTDPLTDLLNRRAFLDRAIGRAGPQTLLIIDIDHFKRVNDTLGHDGGDEVLRLFARTLRMVVPDGALLARLGGEEFAIVVDARRALDVERILAKLRATRMPFDLRVTASAGACSGPLANDRDWKALYHCADRALFDAKSAGRDRVEVAGTLVGIA